MGVISWEIEKCMLISAGRLRRPLNFAANCPNVKAGHRVSNFSMLHGFGK